MMMMMMMVVVVMMVSFICSFNQKCATASQVARNWNIFRSYKAVSGAFRPLLRYISAYYIYICIYTDIIFISCTPMRSTWLSSLILSHFIKNKAKLQRNLNDERYLQIHSLK